MNSQRELDLVVLDGPTADAVLALPGGDEWTVRRWASVEVFRDHVEGADRRARHRLAVAAADSASLDVPTLRNLQVAPQRIDVLVVLARATGDDLNTLYRQGLGRIEVLPLPPQRIDILLNDRSYLAMLFPGDLQGTRRETHEYRLPTRAEAVPGLVRSLCERCDAMGHPNEFVRSQLPLVVDEVLTNAMKHGNGWDASLDVEVVAVLTPASVEIVVRDQGRGFQREAVRDPLDAENRAREGGRGLFLMESIMDDVQYADGGRTVVLSKRLAADPALSRV